jgi:hypothetical protein
MNRNGILTITSLDVSIQSPYTLTNCEQEPSLSPKREPTQPGPIIELCNYLVPIIRIKELFLLIKPFINSLAY